MTEFYNTRAGFVAADTTIGEQFEILTPMAMKNFIFTCLETLEEQGIDVSEALTAVDAIEIEREFDVAVTLTFDLMIKVRAPDEETAETLVQGFEAEDLVNGITSCYDLDGLDNIDMQSNDIVIDGVEEA
jgi:hypothetical protein